MTERNAPEEINEAPVFEALLTPHRSLGRRGFILVMILFAGLCMVNGLVFLLAGAWPILAFCGLDVFLLFGAFWLNYRSGCAREEVSISRTLLSIRKFAPSGKMTEHLFNPFWARFRVDRQEEIGITDMQVSGEGHSTQIGAFLNPDDRESFASAFSGALATVKRR